MRKYQLGIGVTLLNFVLVVTLFMLVIAVKAQRMPPRRASPQNKIPTAKSQNLGWYTFKGPDNDFTIDFPAKPSRAEDVQGPVTILRRYVSTTAATYFEISIQDFGGSPDSPEATAYDPKFEQTLSQMLRDDGFRIVQLRRTAKNIYEMEAWFPSQIPGKYQHNLARGVLRNGRQYRMGCNALVIGQEVDRRVCRRFFNSLRIVGAPK